MAKYQDYELDAMYRDYIDETTDTVTIWGMEYNASTVLQEVDPIAYRVGFSDWLDSLDACDACDKNYPDCECEA